MEVSMHFGDTLHLCVCVCACARVRARARAEPREANATVPETKLLIINLKSPQSLFHM